MASSRALSNGNARWSARAVLVLRILLALTFVAAGGSKLAGSPAMVQIFDAIGIGQWFRIVTGTVEIAGAILLIVPATVGLGAALMTGTMACAVMTHLLRIGGNPVPAIILLLLCAIVLWAKRDDLFPMVVRARGATA